MLALLVASQGLELRFTRMSREPGFYTTQYWLCVARHGARKLCLGSVFREPEFGVKGLYPVLALLSKSQGFQKKESNF